MKIKQEIPIFFSSDDNYVPCLSVAVKSLIDHASAENNYRIIVLHTGMKEKSIEELKTLETKNVKFSFENVSKKVKGIEKDLELRLRDYYSVAIYYRLFIPSMFPEYQKAIYLDADIVILDDIAKMYNIDMKGNILAAVSDATINNTNDFIIYAKQALGVIPPKYFNSGVLLMDLRKMREEKIEEKFLYLLVKYNLETAAPDQDYLNILCKDKVLYLDETWDKMPDFGEYIEEEKLHIIHYNMFRKPWHYEDVPYSEVFWKYAKQTKYYDKLQKELKSYTEFDKAEDLEGVGKLVELTKRIIKQDIKFIDVADDIKNYDALLEEEGEEGSLQGILDLI